jgi:hypothetical protein
MLDSFKVQIEEGENEEEDDDAIGDGKTATGAVVAKRAASKRKKASAPKGKAASTKKSTERKKGDKDDGDDSDYSDDSGDNETTSDDEDDAEEEEDEAKLSSAHDPTKNLIEEVEEVEAEVEAEDADDANVNNDLLALYQDEKDLIENCIKKKPSYLTSLIWSKVLFLDTPSVLQCCDENTAKQNNYEGIKKIQEHVNSNKTSLPVICSICFETPNVGLKGGVVLLHLKTGKGKHAHAAPQTSNFVSHLKSRGREDNKHATFLDSITSARLRSDTSIGTAKSAATATSLVHPVYTEWAKLPKEQVITRMHQLVYLLVNDANIPAHIVRNHRLWDLIEFIAANGKTLDGTPRSTLMMGRHKFNTIQAVSFTEMVSVIERLVDENRKYFKQLTGRTVPFLYVGHDLWDGKNKNVLGLCIFMVSHLLKRMIAFPVGILRSRDKKAVNVAAQSLKALKRYGLLFVG